LTSHLLLDTLPFLEQSKRTPASLPLCLLFILPGKFFLQIVPSLPFCLLFYPCYPIKLQHDSSIIHLLSVLVLFSIYIFHYLICFLFSTFTSPIKI
jgi:hypothetical protein